MLYAGSYLRTVQHSHPTSCLYTLGHVISRDIIGHKYLQGLCAARICNVSVKMYPPKLQTPSAVGDKRPAFDVQLAPPAPRPRAR